MIKADHTKEKYANLLLLIFSLSTLFSGYANFAQKPKIYSQYHPLLSILKLVQCYVVPKKKKKMLQP